MLGVTALFTSAPRLGESLSQLLWFRTRGERARLALRWSLQLLGFGGVWGHGSPSLWRRALLLVADAHVFLVAHVEEVSTLCVSLDPAASHLQLAASLGRSSSVFLALCSSPSCAPRAPWFAGSMLAGVRNSEDSIAEAKFGGNPSPLRKLWFAERGQGCRNDEPYLILTPRTILFSDSRRTAKFA